LIVLTSSKLSTIPWYLSATDCH